MSEFCFDFFCFFFFKQKTAYEMRISDWSSDVCSSDLLLVQHQRRRGDGRNGSRGNARHVGFPPGTLSAGSDQRGSGRARAAPWRVFQFHSLRSEEHTSELQSLMRISYAVFCLKKKTQLQRNN